jgi:hypothetical protein
LKVKAASVAFILALLPTFATATTIGTMFLGGTAEVTLSTIDWAPFVPGPAYDGSGTIVSIGPGTGIFSGVGTGDIGTIVDRDAVGGSVPNQPAGEDIFVPNWLTMPSLGNLVLELTYIVPGVYSSAGCAPPSNNGDTCTPAAPPPFTSPYNLTNFDDGDGLSSNATFAVRGNVRDTSTGMIVGLFDGVFGAEFQDQSLEQVLAQVTAPGGSILASYSATITATQIPEPSTAALAAVGVALIAARFVRRRRSH